MQRQRGGGVCVCVRGGGGGINRLNDTKEQCCDSEQLASSPSVDRPGVLVSAGLHACTHTHLIKTDCLVIVHFGAGRRSQRLLTASAGAQKKTR